MRRRERARCTLLAVNLPIELSSSALLVGVTDPHSDESVVGLNVSPIASAQLSLMAAEIGAREMTAGV